MVFKSIIGAVSACLVVASFNVSAIPTSVDWQSAGDGLLTFDATSGLEWLDLTYTTNRSYNDISSKFSTGMEFDGWRYASSNEVEELWTSFGGNGTYTGWSTANNGLFDVIAPLMGDVYCAFNGCNTGEGYTYGLTGDAFGTTHHYAALIYDYSGASSSANYDLLSTTGSSRFDTSWSVMYGSYLVRASESVPEPSIAILMASGLIAFGVVRRKSRA